MFDGNGNPTSYNGNTVSWDPENRLTAYGSLLTAGYNGDDLRAWKQTASGRTYFLYDGADPVVEMDGSGNVTAVNTFGAAGLVSRHISTGSTFYTFDTQGSTVERLDSSQNVLSTNVYDAFGKLLSGTASDPWGYEAQEGYFTDTEAGLISLSFRYYDPAQGRFLNRDPIGFDGGINLYGYVANGPLTASDPSGTSYEDPSHVGGGGIGDDGDTPEEAAAWAGELAAGLGRSDLGRPGVSGESGSGDGGTGGEGGGGVVAPMSPVDSALENDLFDPDKPVVPGSFSICDWSGYPEGMPRPEGPFRLLEGSEYDEAVKARKAANDSLHRNYPEFRGFDLHEWHPVKFGGDPVDPINKYPLLPEEHTPLTNWWNALQRSIYGRSFE